MQSHEYPRSRRQPASLHKQAYYRPFRPESYFGTNRVGRPRGGPYLPPCRPNEVEIARLLLHTAPEDEISVRVRQSKVGALFRYRVVDEHESKYVVRPATSRHPLTLGGLVAQIETTRHETGSPLGVALLEYQYRASTLPASVWADFLEAQSLVYSQLRAHYRAAVAMWLRSAEGRQR